MGQILDTVPNHMGVATNDNPWWNDVLENGPGSRYANFFDIAWHSARRPELQDRVLLPVLGDLYGQVLESGQIRLSFDGGLFAVHYYDHRFPVDPRTYELVLAHRCEHRHLGEVTDDEGVIPGIDCLPQRDVLLEDVTAGWRANRDLIGWLIARRTRAWFLFVPVGVLAVTAGAYVPFLYMPLFQSMNVVH